MEKSIKQKKEPKKIVKRGLLVGINYTGTCNELCGCINDSENLEKLLLRNNYFNENELIFMNDKKVGSLYPTKENMWKQINDMIDFANSHINDKVYLIFSYSGHGTYQRDDNGDEEDGYDEALCPIDCDERGFIVDDDIREKFISKLGSNVTLIMFIDACHSGTIIDLRYLYECDIKDNCDVNTVEDNTKCQVVVVSGCRDNQTSADAYVEEFETNINEFQGAMTASFIANYTDGISTHKLITKMRKWLKEHRYNQIPQLSSGQVMATTTPFMLSSFK